MGILSASMTSTPREAIADRTVIRPLYGALGNSPTWAQSAHAHGIGRSGLVQLP